MRGRSVAESWTAVDMPELRIVDENLWTATQARRRPPCATPTNRAAQSTTAARPALRASASLLSGLAVCTICGGPITMSGSGKRTRCSGCSYYRNRGPTVCSNTWLEAIPTADRCLLDEIARTVLTPEAKRYALARAAEIVRQRLAAEPDRLPDLKSELMKTEREIEHRLLAVEAGRGRDVTLARLEEKEQLAQGLTTDSRKIDSAPATTRIWDVSATSSGAMLSRRATPCRSCSSIACDSRRPPSPMGGGLTGSKLISPSAASSPPR